MLEKTTRLLNTEINPFIKQFQTAPNCHFRCVQLLPKHFHRFGVLHARKFCLFMKPFTKVWRSSLKNMVLWSTRLCCDIFLILLPNDALKLINNLRIHCKVIFDIYDIKYNLRLYSFMCILFYTFKSFTFYVIIVYFRPVFFSRNILLNKTFLQLPTHLFPPHWTLVPSYSMCMFVCRHIIVYINSIDKLYLRIIVSSQSDTIDTVRSCVPQ